MQIETVNFGRIEVEEDKIITFKENILGFDDYSKYTIINNVDDDIFYWLQSIEEPRLSFVIINPACFVKDYQISIPEVFQRNLGLERAEDMVVYTLVVVGQDKDYLSTNLKAPLIINVQNKLAGQLVLEEDYSIRHILYKKDTAV